MGRSMRRATSVSSSTRAADFAAEEVAGNAAGGVHAFGVFHGEGQEALGGVELGFTHGDEGHGAAALNPDGAVGPDGPARPVCPRMISLPPTVADTRVLLSRPIWLLLEGDSVKKDENFASVRGCSFLALRSRAKGPFPCRIGGAEFLPLPLVSGSFSDYLRRPSFSIRAR